MMNDIKKTLRLMKYGDQFIVYMAVAVIWFVVGVIGMVWMVASAGEVNVAPYPVFLIFVLCPSIMLVQCFASLEATGMVASSESGDLFPKRDRIFLQLAGLELCFCW